MSKIAILPLQEIGHILPTFYVAKTLRDAGHEIVYVGLEDCRAIVEAEAFAYETICGDVLPEGSLARHRERARAEPQKLRATAQEQTWLVLAGRALLSGTEDSRLAAIGADLFLTDRVWQDPMLVVDRIGVKLLLYTVILWAHPTLKSVLQFDPDVPPPSSFRAPRNFGGWQRRVEWPQHGAREAVSWTAREREHFRLGANGERTGVIESATNLALLGRRRTALQKTFLRRHGALRTLVLCPAELDFPRRRPQPCAEYCGPSIDLTRHEPDVDLDLRRDRDRPLIYCTVGSQSHRMSQNIDFFRAIVDAARAHKWRIILSVGDAIAPDALGALPDGVTIARRVPQLRVLERVDAAIVHGGLGTIKECIWFGVPMLVLAGRAHDQPGNAARVAYHGLGFARARDETRANDIENLVSLLISDSARKKNLAAWSESFRARQRENRHIGLIEAAITKSDRVEHRAFESTKYQETKEK